MNRKGERHKLGWGIYCMRETYRRASGRLLHQGVPVSWVESPAALLHWKLLYPMGCLERQRTKGSVELTLRTTGVNHKAKAEACQFRRGSSLLEEGGNIGAKPRWVQQVWSKDTGWKADPNGRGSSCQIKEEESLGWVWSAGKHKVQPRWSHELKTLTQFLFIKCPRNSTCVGHRFPELGWGMFQGEKTGLLEAIQTPLKQGIHTADLQKWLSIRKMSEMTHTHTKKKFSSISAVPWISRIESALGHLSPQEFLGSETVND